MTSRPTLAKSSQSSKYHLDRVFVRRLWRCLNMMFPSLLSTTFLLFVNMLGLTLAEQILHYNAGLIPSQLYQVLGSKDRQGFRAVLFKALALLSATALVKTSVQFVANVSYVKYREVMAQYLHRGYFNQEANYNFNVLDKSIDNPDQRITQDIDRFCQMMRKTFSKLLLTPFTMVYYGYQCYTVAGYVAPSIMFGYFVVGAVINKLIMNPIINAVFKQEKMEGNFRFKHMQVRVNSEALAFYGSGKLEEKKTNKKLKDLVNAQLRIVNLDAFLNISVNMFTDLGTIICYLIINFAIFSGKYNDFTSTELSAVISEVGFVSLYLMKCFTDMIDLSGTITDVAGYTHRIGQFAERMEFYQKAHERKSIKEQQQHIKSDLQLAPNILFKLTGVTYTAPNSSDLLVKDLNLEILKGENIIITGSTGTGKSSLFRVIRGLWTPASGQVIRNIEMKPDEVLFMSQHPLLTNGSLKEQVVYPFDIQLCDEYSRETCYSDEKITELLQVVGLARVCNRVGGINNSVEGNWDEMLSPGEIQRLAFARLFYHRPVLAMLDEATSALDIATEQDLYMKCSHLGITLVSIGHRDSLMQFHNRNLKFLGDGEWVIVDCNQNF